MSSSRRALSSGSSNDACPISSTVMARGARWLAKLWTMKLDCGQNVRLVVSSFRSVTSTCLSVTLTRRFVISFRHCVT